MKASSRPPDRELPALLRAALAASLALVAGALLVLGLSAAESQALARAVPAGTTDAPGGGVLALDGSSALECAAAPPLTSPGGRFTVECRVRGAPSPTTATVLGCRHFGGFGITWFHEGLGLDRPTAWVNVDEVPGTARAGYLLLRPPRPWPTTDWTHLALSFDGRLARLFVDGRLVAESVARGGLRPSRLPLFIGADTNGDGEPVQRFTGEIDDVRVSDVARYRHDFAPPSRNEPDAHTTLLLDFDDPAAPFADRSPRRRRVVVRGAPRRVPAR